MPRSVLLGRPWPQPGEPLWLPQDLDLALAWQEELDQACPGCGHPRDEAWDPDNLPAYEAHTEVCGGCAARERRLRALSRKPTEGVYVYTRFDPRPIE